MGTGKTGPKLTCADELRVNPILKEVFAIIQDCDHSIHNVEMVAGLGYRTLARWQKQNGARLDSVQAVLNAMGYDLEIKKIDEVTPQDLASRMGKIRI